MPTHLPSLLLCLAIAQLFIYLNYLIYISLHVHARVYANSHTFGVFSLLYTCFLSVIIYFMHENYTFL